MSDMGWCNSCEELLQTTEHGLSGIVPVQRPMIPKNFQNRLRDDPRWLFNLRILLSEGHTLALTAWESEKQARMTHTEIDIRARLITLRHTCMCDDRDLHAKKRVQTIFRRGETYYTVPQFKTIDGKDSKRWAIELLIHVPLTKKQKAFVDRFGDELIMVAMGRYGEG